MKKIVYGNKGNVKQEIHELKKQKLGISFFL
jgi:hypothetical protein